MPVKDQVKVAAMLVMVGSAAFTVVAVAWGSWGVSYLKGQLRKALLSV